MEIHISTFKNLLELKTLKKGTKYRMFIASWITWSVEKNPSMKQKTF